MFLPSRSTAPKIPRVPPAFSSVVGLLFVLLLSDCSTPPQGGFKSATRDHAFISYWPPGKDDKRLRVAVKDLIDMKGYITTAGSEFLEKNAKPAKKDAACLAIARKRGVDFVGKTNLTELAVSVSGINTYFGTPHNPLNLRRRLIPGGSSSGSAVAVADDEADVAFGSDTAGSIRVPAACCGVYGLKTTHGLIPLDGVYPVAPTTLDTVGPLAKDVPRLVIGMDLLQEGFAEQYRRAVADHPTAKGIRVGRLYLRGTDARVDAAIDAALQKAGFEVVPLPDAFRDAWVQAQKDALTIATSSAWVHDQSFAGQPGVRPRANVTVFLGLLNFRFGADRGALQREHAWNVVLNGVLKRVDLVALPTVQSLPYHIPLFGGTVAFEARVLAWQNTEAVNYAGNPAIAIPVPIESKLVPETSLQLIGRPSGEAALCNAARLVDSAVRPGVQPAGPERNH